ncbi:unnamed protein product [Ectocarpus sp. 8 AP-2014]
MYPSQLSLSLYQTLICFVHDRPHPINPCPLACSPDTVTVVCDGRSCEKPKHALFWIIVLMDDACLTSSFFVVFFFFASRSVERSGSTRFKIFDSVRSRGLWCMTVVLLSWV